VLVTRPCLMGLFFWLSDKKTDRLWSFLHVGPTYDVSMIFSLVYFPSLHLLDVPVVGQFCSLQVPPVLASCLGPLFFFPPSAFSLFGGRVPLPSPLCRVSKRQVFFCLSFPCVPKRTSLPFIFFFFCVVTFARRF